MTEGYSYIALVPYIPVGKFSGGWSPILLLLDPGTAKSGYVWIDGDSLGTVHWSQAAT
jgi:hypothetical protein